ncbi:MAG: hypothetical protein OXG05_15850 [Gammaproteobacteria bacterium]|nr:hypothetical protein [Gammaproteobacteria bacterium]
MDMASRGAKVVLACRTRVPRSPKRLSTARAQMQWKQSTWISPILIPFDSCAMNFANEICVSTLPC